MTSRGKKIYDQQPRGGQRMPRGVIEDLLEKHQPEIDVRQTGRWSYFVQLTDGCMEVNCWVKWACSRKRVKRFAARKLVRYERKIEREKRWKRELEEDLRS
jgi:hypothetical protein